ncbi:F-box/kelch-repeat protein At1g57790-like [Bidens hawaiensis]|uniref:F-box/kelch-repeat protein At1g57790-like n=1 Tax=Bidens hawaiensis TaxID=980011 RepID=UPI004049F495
MTNQQDESRLFKIPFHMLEMIMEFCADIDYVNFRATCKQLTSPVTLLSNIASIRRLQKYSLVSPWLMVLDNDQGVITFTEPMFGDQYSVRTPIELIGDLHIWCSMYGWLLMSKGLETMMLFNPFTNDIRKLPDREHLFIKSFCLSAPPTSTNCMVIGFHGPCVYIHFVAREPASWRSFHLDFGDDAPSLFRFSKSYDQDIYALNSEGRLSIFTNICDDDEYTWEYVDVPPTIFSTSKARYFLAKRDHDLILVMVGEFGESVELFKVNLSENKWEKIDGLGKHMICICDSTCLCVEAKTPEMENKIYFARFHSEKGKIVFYSLDTCRYHTFRGKRIVGSLGDFCGTRRHIHPHAWIEPSYS